MYLSRALASGSFTEAIVFCRLWSVSLLSHATLCRGIVLENHQKRLQYPVLRSRQHVLEFDPGQQVDDECPPDLAIDVFSLGQFVCL